MKTRIFIMIDGGQFRMRIKGFTIIEILLVMLFIALMCTWVAIDMYQGLDSTALRSNSLGLLRAARYARGWAGAHNQVCRLHINLQESSYWLSLAENRDSLSPPEETPACDVLIQENIHQQKRYLPDKLRFGQVLVGDNQTSARQEQVITFFPDGRAQAGLVQIASNDSTQTLLIFPVTGKSQLYNRAIDELPCETIDLDTGSFSGFDL
ncbi:MAG: hypothetical protein JW860_14930 [Sedimentisphaerales bacterium]|nr:hypothetical protein [Sedimentisphaerales bacterium]